MKAEAFIAATLALLLGQLLVLLPARSGDAAPEKTFDQNLNGTPPPTIRLQTSTPIPAIRPMAEKYVYQDNAEHRLNGTPSLPSAALTPAAAVASPTPVVLRMKSDLPKSCGIVASKVYLEMSGAHWRNIVLLRYRYRNGALGRHALAVWKPSATSNVLLYDESIGTLELPTSATDINSVKAAMEAQFKASIDEIIEAHYLGE